MSRRNLRTLTIKEAAARTRLSEDRINRAAKAGEIRAFRDATGAGKLRRGTWLLLEQSFEAWFDRHCEGGDAPAALADAAAEAEVEAAARAHLDPDADLIAMTPVEDRFV